MAPETAPQLALMEVHVKLEAVVAVGEFGAVVPDVIVLEFKLRPQVLLIVIVFAQAMAVAAVQIPILLCLQLILVPPLMLQQHYRLPTVPVPIWMRTGQQQQVLQPTF